MRVLVLAVVALLVAAFSGGKSRLPSMPAGLSLRQEADRVVVQWNGPVEAPMRERFAEAFEQLENDPRRIVISLHSPGGSVAHGREVIKEIRIASRARQIDTIIEAGRFCASMCVPIYLVGAERLAHPAARFMFHEASFRLSPDQQRALQDLKRSAPQLNVEAMQKTAITQVTNELFDDDFGPRSIDARWLEKMRSSIRGRDVWLTATQLVQQGSGVVDKLY